MLLDNTSSELNNTSSESNLTYAQEKKTAYEPKSIPQVILDSHIIIDLIHKESCEELAQKYEVLALALKRKITGVITAKSLEEIEQELYLCQDIDRAFKFHDKLRKCLILWNQKPENSLNQVKYGHSSDRLRIENYILCASATETKTIVSALPIEDFRKVALDIIKENPININLNVVRPPEFLRWYDVNENQRFSLDKYRLFNSDKISEIESQDQQLFNIKSCQETRTELADFLGVSFSSNHQERMVIKIGDYTLENYEIRSCQGGEAWGKVTLWNSQTETIINEEARSIGSIEAACKALNQAMQIAYNDTIFLPQATHTFKLIADGQGLESKVRATAIVKHQNCLYLGVYEDRDSIQAALFAYARACAKFKNRMYLNSEIAQFYRTDLSGIDLSYINLREANFVEANLTSANLQETILQASDFQGAILTQAKINKANLAHTVATKARFAYADLSETDLTKAILSETDFHEANLSKANFYCTQLNKANLTQANLIKAKFTSANLEGANLTGAKIDSGIMKASLKNAIMPNGRIYRTYQVLHSFEEFEKKYIHLQDHAIPEY